MTYLGEVEVRIEMTLKQARLLGLVVCAHCGLPPNNHWGDGERGGKCAHDPKCPGYEQKIRLPREDYVLGKISR